MKTMREVVEYDEDGNVVLMRKEWIEGGSVVRRTERTHQYPEGLRGDFIEEFKRVCDEAPSIAFWESATPDACDCGLTKHQATGACDGVGCGECSEPWTFGDLEPGDWFVDPRDGGVHQVIRDRADSAVDEDGDTWVFDHDDPVEPFEWEWSE